MSAKGLGFDVLRSYNLLRNDKCFGPLDLWSETDWGCALAGEVGELCNILKKRLRGDADDTLSTEAAGKELADVVIYADLLATRMGLRLGDLVQQKFNEVSDRIGTDIKIEET